MQTSHVLGSAALHKHAHAGVVCPSDSFQGGDMGKLRIFLKNFFGGGGLTLFQGSWAEEDAAYERLC